MREAVASSCPIIPATNYGFSFVNKCLMSVAKNLTIKQWGTWIVTGFTILLASNLQAFDQPLKPFFAAHCLDCHTGEEADAQLDLSSLSSDLTDPQTMATWIRIYDRVQSGEMPPEDVDRPTENHVEDFSKILGPAISKSHTASKGTVLRRLNRNEYQNTLNDLFGTNLKLAEMLPKDGKSHGFDNVGAALSISMVQLQKYMEGIDLVLDKSIAKKTTPPESKIIRASYADMQGAEKFIGDKWLKRDDGAVVFFNKLGYPTGMLREANVRTAGKYKIRVTGYAHQSEKPITFSVGSTTFARGLEKPTYGYCSMPPGKPTTIELEAWIEGRYMIQIEPYGITDNYEIKNNGIENYQGPGLAILHVEVEGPLTDEFPSRGHKLVFTGVDRKEIEPRNPRDKLKSYYLPKFEIITTDINFEAREVLERVATHAFRRPVTSDQVLPYLELFHSEMKQGASFEESLKTAIAAVFCSPKFLYLQEKSGPLDDYALAARLSYFITRTAPDAELLLVAKSGRLAEDPLVLLEQTERLLKHPHSARFVRDFTDAWLDLENIDFTSPDRLLFPEYDPFLKFSMLEETRSFFRNLLDENLSVTNLVKSDFAMLNNRMAELYEIDDVQGPEIRKVQLADDSIRGGFLSQASILKVSANGTNTSPVVRGVWVMDRILGQTPQPPPPGVPGVEPDIRGAETLREILDKHREVSTCNSCHQVIDPPGFALECFDPVGTYRERFRTMGDGERVTRVVHGNKVRYKLGLDVDSTGELQDGSKFNNFNEFRDQLAEQDDVLAKAFAIKLLTFATGREMGFSDRAIIDQIVKQSASNQHRVHDLLHLIVKSEIFRTK
ncbi:MAG: hypothetical protein COA78_32340 [Blastopirellula sp.]|nr:MAG: hypothetical protein COA78_32340 [Blastopirellula sp.]